MCAGRNTLPLPIVHAHVIDRYHENRPWVSEDFTPCEISARRAQGDVDGPPGWTSIAAVLSHLLATRGLDSIPSRAAADLVPAAVQVQGDSDLLD